jgi:hypothetical protein
MLTKKELNKIEERCIKTQRGPWKSYIEGRDHTSGSDFIMTGEGENRDEDLEIFGATTEDYDFIASAKQDVPLLINEIKRLNQLLTETLNNQ